MPDTVDESLQAAFNPPSVLLEQIQRDLEYFGG